MNKKVWTQKEIVQLLQTNDTAVERALFAIYRLQTDQEKNAGQTIVHNGVGFSSSDSKFAQYLVGYLKIQGNHLSEPYLSRARTMMVKYRRQLKNIANR